jgi:hypothetical protein
MRELRVYKLLILWLATGMALASCGGAGPTAVITATPASSVAATVPAPTETSVPTPVPPRDAIDLIILHTNDNWGETEPCG